MREDRIWRLIFYPLAALALCGAAYVLFAVSIGHAVVLVIVGALFLLAPRLKDLIKLEVGVASIKAEMQQAVADARATVEQLHILAAELGKQIVRSAQAEGRWGGRTRADRGKVAEETAVALRALGMSEAAISEVVAAERPFIRFDYANWASESVKPTSEETQRWNDFFKAHRSGIGSEPDPQKLRDFLETLSNYSEETNQRLIDYDHYSKNFHHRRREKWFAGRDD